MATLQKATDLINALIAYPDAVVKIYNPRQCDANRQLKDPDAQFFRLYQYPHNYTTYVSGLAEPWSVAVAMLVEGDDFHLLHTNASSIAIVTSDHRMISMVLKDLRALSARVPAGPMGIRLLELSVLQDKLTLVGMSNREFLRYLSIKPWNLFGYHIANSNYRDTTRLPVIVDTTSIVLDAYGECMSSNSVRFYLDKKPSSSFYDIAVDVRLDEEWEFLDGSDAGLIDIVVKLDASSPWFTLPLNTWAKKREFIKANCYRALREDIPGPMDKFLSDTLSATK